MNVYKVQCLDRSGTAQIEELPFPPQQSLPKMHSLRRPGLNFREIRLMHENTLQIAKCYFLQWTPSAVKVTFGKCLLPVHWDRTDQSLPAGCNRDEDGWLSLKVLYFPQMKMFSDSLKFYTLLFWLYLWFRIPSPFTFIMGMSN